MRTSLLNIPIQDNTSYNPCLVQHGVPRVPRVGLEISQQSTETVNQRVASTQRSYQSARRASWEVRDVTSDAKRIKLLYAWNDAAREYLSACIAAVKRWAPNTRATGAGRSTGCEKRRCTTAPSGRKSSPSRSMSTSSITQPGPVRPHGLRAARQAAGSNLLATCVTHFISVGLATYGFDDTKEADHDREQTADRKRWFAFGCGMFAIAVGFAVWGFALGDVTATQRRILLWILPLASGFGAGAIGGGINVRARGLGRGSMIVASGGIAV